MSAYLVCATHIDALLTAGLLLPRPSGTLRWQHLRIDTTGDARDQHRSSHQQPVRHELTRATASRAGAVLLAENQRSLNHRYHEHAAPPRYEFTELPGYPDPVSVLVAIDGYQAQASMHEQWPTSEAHQFCQALRAAAIRRLPGYQQSGCWHIHERTVFLTTATGQPPTPPSA